MLRFIHYKCFFIVKFNEPKEEQARWSFQILMSLKDRKEDSKLFDVKFNEPKEEEAQRPFHI